MCGICGIVGKHQPEVIKKMNEVLNHRGPDEEGYFFDKNISLGHKRLSIIDLTSGKQPMCNEDNSIWIIFNGEIYNYLELREVLIKQGHKFKTSSDTEVIIHSYEEYGYNCFNKFNGEFAIAIYDKNKQQLVLARDRFGIRPLYYTLQNNIFLFASELKSILVSGLIKKELNYSAVNEYLTLRFVPEPETLIKNIYKLPPANYVIFKNNTLHFHCYWNLPPEENYFKNQNEVEEEFNYLLQDAVKLRLRSDVPVGTYLSGGVDSAVVSALGVKFSNYKMNSFTVGFNSSVDEFAEAKAISNFLNTNHFDFTMPKNILNELPKIIWHLDEPLGDAIILPLFLLAQQARKKVKVVLTGEGADEIFGGYIHHLVLYFLQKIFKDFNGKNKKYYAAKLIKVMPQNLLEKLFPYPAILGEAGKERLLNLLLSKNFAQSYLSFSALFSSQQKEKLYQKDFYNLVKINSQLSLEEKINLLFSKFTYKEFLNNLIAFDINFWLNGNILFKQDKITMASSLEARVPYLDHRLVEFALKIPAKYKIKNLKNKIILKNYAKKIFPENIINKSKKAFYVPVEECLKKETDNIAQDLFHSKISSQYFNKSALQNIFKDLPKSNLLGYKRIFTVMNFLVWEKINKC